MKRQRLATVALTLLIATIGCGGEKRRAKSPLEHKKSLVLRLPSAFSAGTLITSDDGRHVLYGVLTDDQHGRLFFDGRPTDLYTNGRFPWITKADPPLMTFFGTDEAGHRYLLVNGQPIRIGVPNRNEWIQYSDDGRRYAVLSGLPPGVVGETPDALRAMVVADGTVVGRYPDASVPRFSPDNQHHAFLAETPDGSTRVVVDGSEVRRFPPPSKACTVRLEPPSEGPGLWRQNDGRFLSDGRLVTLTTDAEGWSVYRDGERLASYPVNVPSRAAELNFSIEAPDCLKLPAIFSGSLDVAREAPVAAWWARQPTDRPDLSPHWQVVRDGTPVTDITCIRPWDPQPPVLSGNGRRVAYPCVTGIAEGVETTFVVHDDRWYGPYSNTWSLALSPDGEHIAYAASYGDFLHGWQLFLDGRPFTAPYYSTWRPYFSPDGSQIAWVAQKDRDGKIVIGVGRHVVARCDQVVGGPGFTEDGWVAFVIRRGRLVSRLVVRPRS